MLLFYGEIDEVLVAIYSNRYLGIVAYIYCCMLCLFAAVSSSFLIVIKYSIVVGAANVIKIYCSHTVQKIQSCYWNMIQAFVSGACL